MWKILIQPGNGWDNLASLSLSLSLSLFLSLSLVPYPCYIILFDPLQPGYDEWDTEGSANPNRAAKFAPLMRARAPLPSFSRRDGN